MWILGQSVSACGIVLCLSSLSRALSRKCVSIDDTREVCEFEFRVSATCRSAKVTNASKSCRVLLWRRGVANWESRNVSLFAVKASTDLRGPFTVLEYRPAECQS